MEHDRNNSKNRSSDILERGIEEGNNQGQNALSALFSYLFDNGRIEDAKKASKDPELRKKLLEELKSQMR